MYVAVLNCMKSNLNLSDMAYSQETAYICNSIISIDIIDYVNVYVVYNIYDICTCAGLK